MPALSSLLFAVSLLCTSTLSRPLNPPSVTLVPRVYNPNDSDLPPSVLQVCEAGVNSTSVSNSTMFGNSQVVMTTGACTPANVTDPVMGADSVQTCMTAANDCQSRFGSLFQGNGYVGKCGTPCDSTCYPGSNGPDPNDCQTIANSLRTHNPLVFTLNPNNFLLLSYKTCGIGFQNQIAASSIGCSQQIIYDYPDMADVLQYLAWNCQSSQGARGGRCTSRSGVYQSTVPDFYVQVYPNTS